MTFIGYIFDTPSQDLSKRGSFSFGVVSRDDFRGGRPSTNVGGFHGETYNHSISQQSVRSGIRFHRSGNIVAINIVSSYSFREANLVQMLVDSIVLQS